MEQEQDGDDIGPEAQAMADRWMDAIQASDPAMSCVMHTERSAMVMALALGYLAGGLQKVAIETLMARGMPMGEITSHLMAATDAGARRMYVSTMKAGNAEPS